ncbi:MAG: TetR family transcriptional regulator [Nitriliruptorales bacterium]|nr:TetR family transcriptional regulator [Nitriliruptorales bacterium]
MTDDRTARARIRDAALQRFADDGPGASVRGIAAEAGVSPALVMHHFGSKETLRHACDEYIAATIRDRKRAAMAAGPGFDPVAALREAGDGPPLMRYLARTLVEGSQRSAALVDEMVDDAVRYMAEGVQTGVLRPTAYPRERAALLTLWSLGALVLHEHAERLLGVELTGPPEKLAEAASYFAPALEIFSDGLLSDEAASTFRSTFGHHGDVTGPHNRDKETGS